MPLSYCPKLNKLSEAIVQLSVHLKIIVHLNAKS